MRVVRIGCIVLAAGAGRRFGGAKQLARLDGRPLLSHVLGVVASVPVLDPVVVVLGAHAEAIRAEVDFGSLRVVECAGWEEGQSASLRAGALAVGDVDAAVVLLGDMPFVTVAVIEAAVAELTEEFDVVRAIYDGEVGHPVVLGRAVLDALPGVSGDVGARDLMRSFRVRRWDAGAFGNPLDIDTPEQLDAAAGMRPRPD
jgi:CTP:molybdopterin cytidylyltransferase MocA